MAHEERGGRPTEGDHESAGYQVREGAHTGSLGADDEPSAGSAERGASEREDSDLEDELRVQRSEEELRAGTREREAGRINVRKSVRTEREEVQVPRRREEVDIERVPVNREAPEAKIGEDDEVVVVQVFEEEIVVSKRVVLKEEIRIRKDVVEDTEVVEVDLRKEEVEIDDQTTSSRREQ